jgi:hypothetical protein
MKTRLIERQNMGAFTGALNLVVNFLKTKKYDGKNKL